MQGWRKIPSFCFPSFAMKRTRILVCSRSVSCCLRVLIGHRVPIISLIEWLKSWKIHVFQNVRAQKDIRGVLFIEKTVSLIVACAGDALGIFTRSGNVFPISADLSDSCRNFTVERNTTIKIYWDLDVLFINKVHNVIERNRFSENMTTIWCKVSLRDQIRRNFKLCRTIRSVLGFIVVVHRFMRKGSFSSISREFSTDFWSYACIGEKFL